MLNLFMTLDKAQQRWLCQELLVNRRQRACSSGVYVWLNSEGSSTTRTNQQTKRNKVEKRGGAERKKEKEQVKGKK